MDYSYLSLFRSRVVSNVYLIYAAMSLQLDQERRNDNTADENSVERAEAESSTDGKGGPDEEQGEQDQNGDSSGSQSANHKDEEQQSGQPEAYVFPSISLEAKFLATILHSC